jgi:hypothetical protein
MNVTIFVDRYNQLDVDPFLVNTIRFEEKKILVRTDKVGTTKGENVVVSDELRNKMIKPRSLEAEVLRENVRRKPTQRIKPNFVSISGASRGKHTSSGGVSKGEDIQATDKDQEDWTVTLHGIGRFAHRGRWGLMV